MGALSRWAVRRPVIALVAWIIALAGVIGAGVTLGGELNDSFELPDTESKIATDLLISSGTDTSRLDGGATVVWSPESGPAVDPAIAQRVVPVLTEIAALDSVTCVTNPLDPAGASIGRDCPEGGGLGPAVLQALTPEEAQMQLDQYRHSRPRPA